MEAIRQWASSICFAAVAGGITLLLAPNSGLKKVMKMTVMVFFISAMALPLTNLSVMKELEDMEMYQPEELSNQVAQTSKDAAISAAKSQLETSIKKIISDLGIKADSIAINITTDEQENLKAIAEIELSDSQGAEEEKLKEILKSAGIDAQIKGNYNTDTSKSE